VLLPGKHRMLVRRTLYWKYAAYFTGLVSALLVLSGAVGGYFAYRESMSALEAVQRANARFTAAEIASFMQGALNAVQAAVDKFNTKEQVDAENLRIELLMLLRHHPEISDLRWIAPDGEERFYLSRFELNAENRGRNWSDDRRFRAARSASPFVGPVYFRKGTEPYVTIAAARDPSSSVLEAEVNLKFVWDVVSQVPRAATEVVYVVDRGGQLISHTDMGLVLGKADLSIVPHVRRLLDQTEQTITAGKSTDIRGQPVIATAAPIAALGWTVFAEQSVETALRPVYASITRSVVVVLIGIAVAFAASLLLARRMVRPIREIEARARELGEGQFERPIAVRTGDELEALAGQFNRMAARLQETHAMQEARIVERTHELSVANEAKTRFLAAASHDLRQPIHALALFVGQLRAVQLPGKAASLIEKIERSVEALKELLEALLDLSKLDAGAVAAETRALALNDLLSRLASQAAPMAEAKGLALTLVSTTLWVRSDPLLLERIFLNVISNALRYTDQGRILIGCRRRGENVEVIVADTGIGIDSMQLPNVFQEFYRAAAGHRGMDNGHGLGLAIVKRLAHLLDHRVRIESELGRGTVVRILVPRAEPQEPAFVPEALIVESLRGIRVLVIDDETLVRDAIQGLLAQWDCEVITAERGDEALELARGRRPDVVLCDLRLADGESGLDVVNRLRRECGSGVACAFVTGEMAPERIAEARATGHPIAFKPTTPGKLRALLEYLVRTD
jgi:signal transduction histidine kinase